MDITRVSGAAICFDQPTFGSKLRALDTHGNWTTRGYANSRIGNSRTGHLADWSTRGLDNSRTGQVADWTTRGYRQQEYLLF